mgnify:CR=1 FL=1
MEQSNAASAAVPEAARVVKLPVLAEDAPMGVPSIAPPSMSTEVSVASFAPVTPASLTIKAPPLAVMVELS